VGSPGINHNFLLWEDDDDYKPFPWDWSDRIRKIELDVERRLQSRGLYTLPNLFCSYDPDNDQACTCSNKEHKLLASKRTEVMINTWGAHLFPLIDESEIRLQTLRELPKGTSPRADYYEMEGIADVLSSVNILKAPKDNEIIENLRKIPELNKQISALKSDKYEIIVDYKGTNRPSLTDVEWRLYNWQILTYAYLRSQQKGSNPVVAGILIFVNELEPSITEYMGKLKKEVAHKGSDVLPVGDDLQKLKKWKSGKPPRFSEEFMKARSMLIVPVNDKVIEKSLGEWDNIVGIIEGHIEMETGGKSIIENWPSRPELRSCTACDHKHFCPSSMHISDPKKRAPSAP